MYSRSSNRLMDDDDEGDDDDDDNVRLLRPPPSDDDVESGVAAAAAAREKPPPAWVGRVEALQYSLSRLEAKITELDTAHKNHLARPTLDDNPKEEERIRHVTKDISEVQHHS